MKTFTSELGHNYGTYTFGYANYCQLEPDDKLAELYQRGYLPYSGHPNAKNIFYMARSARVPLAAFALSSENRRVAKKFDGQFQVQETPPEQFAVRDREFVAFCTDYFAARHGPEVMPPARLQSILGAGLLTHIVSYHCAGQPVAYVFEVRDKAMTHFWYSFYDLALVHQSLGLWLMLDSARRAKARDQKHFYIGTVYGQKALYKTAFKNLEFWDGKHWITDVRKIKQLGRSDNQRLIGLTDLWKEELKSF